jgi:hypothetical protein
VREGEREREGEGEGGKKRMKWQRKKNVDGEDLKPTPTRVSSLVSIFIASKIAYEPREARYRPPLDRFGHARGRVEDSRKLAILFRSRAIASHVLVPYRNRLPLQRRDHHCVRARPRGRGGLETLPCRENQRAFETCSCVKEGRKFDFYGTRQERVVSSSETKKKEKSKSLPPSFLSSSSSTSSTFPIHPPPPPPHTHRFVEHANQNCVCA